MEERIVIVGLGNPGKKYSRHRHNAGFIAVDSICERLAASAFSKDKRGLHTSAIPDLFGNKVELFFYKPQEFMNCSGAGVKDFLKKHPVPPNRIVVLHDEIELPFGEVRFKTGGGHKGHNGLRDIIEKCGGADFHRIRLGVGRPEDGAVADYVLSDFSSDEWEKLSQMNQKAYDLLNAWIKNQIQAAAG